MRLLVLTLCCAGSSALYFMVTPAARCFTIDEPRDTPLIFSYNVMDEDHTVDLGIYYGVVANEEMRIQGKKIHKVGHVDFVTDNEGEFALCFNQGSVYDIPTRMQLTITYGHDNDYYEKIGKQEDYDPMNIEVHRLNDQIRLALNEAAYQKRQELAYHIETERINTSLVWWPMLQIVILLIAGFFQVDLLKRFFKSNKLI